MDVNSMPEPNFFFKSITSSMKEIVPNKTIEANKNIMINFFNPINMIMVHAKVKFKQGKLKTHLESLKT